MSSQISIVDVKVETISMALFFIVAVVLVQQIHGPGRREPRDIMILVRLCNAIYCPTVTTLLHVKFYTVSHLVP